MIIKGVLIGIIISVIGLAIGILVAEVFRGKVQNKGRKL